MSCGVLSGLAKLALMGMSPDSFLTAELSDGQLGDLAGNNVHAACWAAVFAITFATFDIVVPNSPIASIQLIMLHPCGR